MREIKFRVWYKQEQKMYQPNYFHFSPSGDLFGVLVKEGELLSIEDFELMQFTGLKDHNDKEIYEGDILQETFMGKVLEWSLWQVGYEQGASGVYRPPNAGEEEPTFQSFFDGFQDLDRFSVIGNIYENPELVSA